MDREANVEQTDGHGQSLEQVQQRFRRWRESRKQGQRIPAVLWAAAAGIARQHGVHRVARELRLDYNGLKKRVGQAGPATRSPKIDAQFVELFAAPEPASTVAPVCECAVELENARGAKMRVQLKRPWPGRLGAPVQFVLERAVIQITAHMRILVAVAPIDFRGGIDALVGACRQRLASDPFGGALFVFGNRARTGIKILVYDGQGFWLCHKRLSSGRFAFWPAADTPTHSLQACELQVLLMGGDPTRTNAAPTWRGLSLAA